MTIFPTHKTELKTKLTKQEVLNNLEQNNIYTVGFYYELKQTNKSYILNPFKKERGRNLFSPVVNVKLSEKPMHTQVNLSFSPLKATSTGVLISSLLLFIACIGVAVLDIANTGFSVGTLLYLPIGLLFYIIAMLMFSFEVISIRTQIEEHIEAEPEEVKEPSKLQDWYEKDREPFKFRNK
ncbi:MAG: hypothetical protein IJ346_00950 [Clostridia bacterium]|nr:hypothetical protein [Clostridia bacterium]